MASGWIHGPFTLARNTCGAPVTQKREWMQRFASNSSSIRSPCAVSTPPLTVDTGATPEAAAGSELAAAPAVAAAGAAGAGATAAAAAPGTAADRSKPLLALEASEASWSAAATARASPLARSGAAPSANWAKRSTNTRRAAGPGGSAAESRSVMNDTPALHCGFDGPAGRRAARSAFALLDDRRERGERGLQTHDVPGTGQIHFLGRELQRPIAVESVRLAAVRHQGAQPLPEGRIEVADGVVVDAHGGEPRPAGAAAHVAALVGKAAALRLGGAVRTLQEHEVLQGVGIERGELDHHARGQ